LGSLVFYPFSCSQFGSHVSTTAPEHRWCVVYALKRVFFIDWLEFETSPPFRVKKKKQERPFLTLFLFFYFGVYTRSSSWVMGQTGPMVKALAVDRGRWKGFFLAIIKLSDRVPFQGQRPLGRVKQTTRRKGKEEKKNNIFLVRLCVCVPKIEPCTQSVVVRGTMKGANQKEVNKPKGANEPPRCNL